MGDMKTHFRGLVHGEFEEELDDIDEEAITRWLGESSASDDRPDPDLPNRMSATSTNESQST